MTIEKKVWPEYFQRIIGGDKKYELRLADFECGIGDVLLLKEWDPKTKEYTGREVSKEVTYVIKTKEIEFWSQEEIDQYGFQIISFK
jgi:ribosomal protein S17